MEDESYNSVTKVNLSSIYPSDPESPRPDNFLQVDKCIKAWIQETKQSDLEFDTKVITFE